MTSVLVTGASGFVGRQVMEALAELPVEVHGITHRPATGQTLPKATAWHQADLLEGSRLDAILGEVRPTHCLHLAWCVDHGRFWNDPANVDWLAASCRLLRKFTETGGKRFVGVGTCAEYAAQAEPCEELSTPLQPSSLYAASKNAFHEILACFAEESGISHSWARLFFLFGPWEHPQRLVPYIVTSLLNGVPANVSRGTQLRDFLDVRDAGRALALLLLGEAKGAVNIASGRAVSIAELATRLAALLGRPDLLKLGVRPDRPGDPPVQVAAIGRQVDDIGIPAGRELDDGLRQVIDWWRDRSHPG